MDQRRFPCLANDWWGAKLRQLSQPTPETTAAAERFVHVAQQLAANASEQALIETQLKVKEAMPLLGDSLGKVIAYHGERAAAPPEKLSRATSVNS